MPGGAVPEDDFQTALIGRIAGLEGPGPTRIDGPGGPVIIPGRGGRRPEWALHAMWLLGKFAWWRRCGELPPGFGIGLDPLGPVLGSSSPDVADFLCPETLLPMLAVGGPRGLPEPLLPDREVAEAPTSRFSLDRLASGRSHATERSNRGWLVAWWAGALLWEAGRHC